MSESNETKFARVEGKVDNLTGIVTEVKTNLEKRYVTTDQLELKVQEFKPLKTLVIWLLSIVALETIGLLFYLIRALIEQRVS